MRLLQTEIKPRGQKINHFANHCLIVGLVLVSLVGQVPRAEAPQPQQAEQTEQEAEPASTPPKVEPEIQAQPEAIQQEQVTKAEAKSDRELEFWERVEKYRPLFKQEFGTSYKTAMAICMKESELIADQFHQNYDKNSTTDHGLCQINLYWNYTNIEGATDQEKINNLYNPEYNVKLAKKIFDGWQNFEAWTCYKNGSYRDYLNKI